jgi:hypothetical protein
MTQECSKKSNGITKDGSEITLWLPYNANSHISTYLNGGLVLFCGDQYPNYQLHKPILKILYPKKRQRIIIQKNKIHGIIKSYLLCIILSNYDIHSKEFQQKLSFILPKGINCSKVCTDKEYYNLKKEFKIQFKETFDYYYENNNKLLPKKDYNIYNIINYCNRHNSDFAPFFNYFDYSFGYSISLKYIYWRLKFKLKHIYWRLKFKLKHIFMKYELLKEEFKL